MPTHHPKWTLEREISCYRGLKWRMQLQPDGDLVTRLACRMIRQGYKEWVTPFYPNVLGVMSDERHEIVFVPRTGRVQIRVHYTVEPEQRPVVALEIAEELRSCYRSLVEM